MLKRDILQDFFFGLLLIYFFVISGNAEMTNLHSSIYSLEILLRDEIEFIKRFEKYVSEQNDTSSMVKVFMNDLYSNYDPGVNLRSHVSNPLNAFALVKRTSYELDKFLRQIKSNKKVNTSSELKLNNKIKDLVVNFSPVFPSIEDFDEVCISIALLQETYSLNVTDLMRGIVRSKNNVGILRTINSASKLDCNDIYQIGIRASEFGWYASAHSWLNVAHKECKEENKSLYKNIKKAFMKNIEDHDNTFEITGKIGAGHTFSIPIDPKLQNSYKYKKSIKTIDSNNEFETIYKLHYHIPLYQSNATSDQSRDNFYTLCSNGRSMWRTQDMNMNLKCRFLTHLKPYLKIGPFATEELNFNPAVVLFHQFLSTKETSYIEGSGKTKLKRSRIFRNRATMKSHASIKRTSKESHIAEKDYRFPVTEEYLGWDNHGLFRTDYGITKKTCPDYPTNVQDNIIINDLKMYLLTKRIELATRLVLDRPYASESFRVVNYGIGGQFDVHRDNIGYHTTAGRNTSISKDYRLWYSLTGGRQSTFMAYLSTVEIGGGTSFPLLGLKSMPVAGDAIFWNNIYSDGKPDDLSLHGGCPVVLGSKWVTTKWISNYDNYQTTPCDLKEHEPLNTVTSWRKSNI